MHLKVLSSKNLYPKRIVCENLIPKSSTEVGFKPLSPKKNTKPL